MKIQFTTRHYRPLISRQMVQMIIGGILFLALPARGEAPVVPVSSGTSLTIFEMTGKISETTFPISEILAGESEFLTVAGEKYTVTSDGTYVTISCLHDPDLLKAELEDGALLERNVPSTLPFEILLGHSAGNNLVAVRLDGSPGFPSGLWASLIVSYTVGPGGIPESRFNALGDVLARGPYLDRYYTVLGTGSSEITLGFSPLLEVAIEAGRIPPADASLPLFIQIPEGYSATDFDFYSVEIADAAGVPTGFRPVGWWSSEDYDGDGVAELRMEFNWADLCSRLLPGDNLILVRGTLYSGIAFQGRVTLAGLGVN